MSKIKITTWRNDHEWSACYGDYDLGVPVGTGVTESIAIIDLLYQTEESSGKVPDRWGGVSE